MIQLTIPALPPSANHMYITLKGGKRMLSPQVEAFRALVLQAVLPERPEVPDGPLSLTLHIWPGDKRKCDLDNFLKVAQDAVAIALHFDDTRIWHVEATRVGCDPGKPHCVITLEALR